MKELEVVKVKKDKYLKLLMDDEKYVIQYFTGGFFSDTIHETFEKKSLSEIKELFDYLVDKYSK